MGRKVDLQNTNKHTHSHTHTTKIGQKIAGFFFCFCFCCSLCYTAAPSLSFFQKPSVPDDDAMCMPLLLLPLLLLLLLLLALLLSHKCVRQQRQNLISWAHFTKRVDRIVPLLLLLSLWAGARTRCTHAACAADALDFFANEATRGDAQQSADRPSERAGLSRALRFVLLCVALLLKARAPLLLCEC